MHRIGNPRTTTPPGTDRDASDSRERRTPTDNTAATGTTARIATGTAATGTTARTDADAATGTTARSGPRFTRLPQPFRPPIEPRPWYRRAARAIIVTVSILVAALLLGLAAGITTSLF